MQKQKELNRWFWKWHVIAGLLSLPVMLLLCITGILYLFKADFNDFMYGDIYTIQAPENIAQTQIDYNQQLETVKSSTDLHVTQVILPESTQQAVAYRLHGKKGDHTRNLIYVNPYTSEITGQVNQRDTLMYKVRKLHGELLLNTAGTYVVELVASWFLVLIITGIYVWWPANRLGTFSLAGFFTIRTKKGKRLFFRDLHAVGSFWLSLVMAVILAGGMPWTEFFGDNLKKVQEETNTGYPKHWNNSRGLQSTPINSALSLNDIVDMAQDQNLPGKIIIKLPTNAEQVFSLTNISFWLSDQRVMHFDQYSGDLIKESTWEDVGILMDLRQIAMRFHQGEYGLINWLAILMIVLTFTLATIAALVSYLIRKPNGRWGIPTVPESFSVSYGLAIVILFLGIIFPMFGGSLLLIIFIEQFIKLASQRKASYVN